MGKLVWRSRALGFKKQMMQPTQKQQMTRFLTEIHQHLLNVLPKNYRTRIALESILLLLAIVCALVWFATPYYARDYINHSLANLPDYRGRIEWIRIHPYTASADIYNFHMEKKTGKIPVPFLYVPHVRTSLQWSQLFDGSFRSSIIIFSPQINLVAGPSSAQSQLSLSMIWINTLKKLVPWRINQIRIHQGNLHFLDFHADPQVDLQVCRIEAAAENISNSKNVRVPLPAMIKITARPLVTGDFGMTLAVNFDERYATFTQNFRMEHVPAKGANSALKKYLKVEAKSGEIGLYSELSCNKGIYQGYIKPFFSHLEFEPKPDDKDTPGVFWASILNIIKGLVENDKEVIATQASISGRVDQPNIDVLSAITGVLWNAYVKSLQPGFDPLHSPPVPTDTVTTPQSPALEKEAELLPRKEK